MITQCINENSINRNINNNAFKNFAYKEVKNQRKDSAEFVDEIMTQVSYMTKTIDDFRDFIKPSLKKKCEFEINSSINELFKIIEHNIKYNYIK